MDVCAAAGRAGAGEWGGAHGPLLLEPRPRLRPPSPFPRHDQAGRWPQDVREDRCGQPDGTVIIDNQLLDHTMFIDT